MGTDATKVSPMPPPLLKHVQSAPASQSPKEAGLLSTVQVDRSLGGLSAVVEVQAEQDIDANTVKSDDLVPIGAGRAGLYEVSDGRGDSFCYKSNYKT